MKSVCCPLTIHRTEARARWPARFIASPSRRSLFKDLPGYRVSDMELTRSGHSYTADSLRTLHAAGWKPLQIFFILGADAFAEIATWREFPAVLDGANFVVVARPGTGLEEAAARTPALYATGCTAPDRSCLRTGKPGSFSSRRARVIFRPRRSGRDCKRASRSMTWCRPPSPGTS